MCNTKNQSQLMPLGFGKQNRLRDVWKTSEQVLAEPGEKGDFESQDSSYGPNPHYEWADTGVRS